MAEEFGLAINVDMTPPRYGELALKVGENVHVFPQRIRAFRAGLRDLTRTKNCRAVVFCAFFANAYWTICRRFE